MKTFLKIFFLMLIIFLISQKSYSQLRIDGQKDLVFAEIVPGNSKTITATNSNAAKFYVFTAPTPFPLLIEFILPTHIISGINTVPVTFSQANCVYNVGIDSPVGGVNFNPYENLIIPGEDVEKRIYIFLGGVANTTLQTVAGNYSADIVGRVQYMAN